MEVKYAYNDDGSVRTITSNFGGTYYYTYDPYGRLSGIKRLDSTEEDYQVSVFGKATSTEILKEFEKAAYNSEKNWWDYYNFMNGGK